MPLKSSRALDICGKLVPFQWKLVFNNFIWIKAANLSNLSQLKHQVDRQITLLLLILQISIFGAAETSPARLIKGGKDQFSIHYNSMSNVSTRIWEEKRGIDWFKLYCENSIKFCGHANVHLAYKKGDSQQKNEGYFYHVEIRSLNKLLLLTSKKCQWLFKCVSQSSGDLRPCSIIWERTNYCTLLWTPLSGFLG